MLTCKSINITSSGYIEQLIKFEPASPLFGLHQFFHLHLDMIVSVDQDHLPMQRHFVNLSTNTSVFPSTTNITEFSDNAIKFSVYKTIVKL